MQGAFLIIGVVLGICLGGGLGYGIASYRLRDLDRERSRIEQARLQGQIDSLRGNRDKPSINPPSNYFGRHDE